MSDTTGINWADSTFNPWIGCTKVGPGCDNCYAERDFDKRRHVVQWGAGNPRKRTAPANWRKPLQWDAKPFYKCPSCGWRGEDDTQSSRLRICLGCSTRLQPTRRRVFCASLADVFDNEVDPQWRKDLFDLIRATPSLDWLVLTKRIGNVPMMISIIPGHLPANVWLGISVVNQAEARRDIPKLLAVPARLRFLSIEPMVGHIDLWQDGNGPLAGGHPTQSDIDGPNGCHYLRHGTPQIDWVIAGGESGPGARPIHPDWVRSLRDQCATAGVPFLFKQWGEWVPMMGHAEGVPVVGQKFTHPDGTIMGRAGTKSAGRQLSGIEHNGFPEVA